MLLISIDGHRTKSVVALTFDPDRGDDIAQCTSERIPRPRAYYGLRLCSLESVLRSISVGGGLISIDIECHVLTKTNACGFGFNFTIYEYRII